MKDYLKLMRVKHYIKNFLIFAVIIFSSNLFNLNMLFTNILNFVSFSLTCSIVYTINDIFDIEKDKKHPTKKNRPLASGKISKRNAYIFVLILFSFSSIINFLPCIFNKDYSLLFTYLCLYGYLIMNILYSIKLKHVPIVDIFILTLGFLIRVVYGSVSIGVSISNWMYLTVLAVSFYAALGKRRNEYIKNGSKSREVLKYYNKEYLNKFMNTFTTAAIVFYSLWANNMNSVFFLISILFVIFILMRYSLIVEGDSLGDPVDVVLNDKLLFFSIIAYGLYMGGVLYAF